MKRLTIIAVAIFGVLLLSSSIFGQIVIGGFNTSTQPGGTNNFGTSPLPPSTVATNATVGGLTRGAGVSTTGTGAARGMGGVAFNTADAAASIAANKFFTFTVKANSGYTLSLSSINPFDYRRSATGPPSALVQYQINSGTFADITTVSFTSTASTGGSIPSINLSGISALQNLPDTSTVTFRIVPYGASASTGTFYFFDVANSTADDLAVNGTLTSVVVAPNLTINDVSLNEGNAGTTSFTFTVSLSSQAPTGGVTFDIATAAGTATAPTDYTAKTLTSQTIPAGSSTYSFTVLVNGDTTVETNETFFVNVTNVSGATATDGQGQGTIVNDDVANNPPTITPQNVSVERGATQNNVTIANVTDDGGNGNVNVTVTSANPSNGVTISAIANTDGTITATINAACGAGDASFTLSASDGVNPPVTGTLNVTVTDSQVATQLSFSTQPGNTNSGATITPPVQVSALNACGAVVAGFTGNITVSLNGSGVLNGTTTVAATNGTATFSDLSVTTTTTGSFTLTASSAGVMSVISNPFTVTVAATPGVTITPSSVEVTEGGATAVYSIVLDSQPTADVTISAAAFNGQVTLSATNCLMNPSRKSQQLGDVGFSVVFTPQNYATPQCVLVTAIDDADVEGNHFDFIEHSAASADSNYNGIEINGVEVNITDNEMDTTAPVISYAPLSATNSTSDGDRRVIATVSDEGFGVVFVGEDRPRIYFNKNGGAFVSEPCNADGFFYCDIDYSDLGGVQVGDIISYFVVAQDFGGNLASNPAGITGNNVNTITIPEGYAPNAYAIGNTTVPAGNYSTINLFGGALAGNVRVLTAMNFNGIITVPNGFALEIDCNAALNGGSETAYIVGNLRKDYCASSPSEFIYPVGTAVPPALNAASGVQSEFSPVTVTITALNTDPSSLTINAVDNFLPGSNSAQSISRYWNVVETGDLTANLSFKYRNEDVPAGADESTFKVLRRENTTAVYADENSVDENANTATALGVSNFSQWGAGNLAPTAANVSVAGQVRSGKTPISNTTVMITGGNLTQPLFTRSNSFGNYSFDGLAVGQTFVVTVVSNRYNFPQSSIVLNLTDNIADADFEAEER